ncbi:hypothetical protein [Tenacibaculum maritimum]|uniref:hypothetical protein n=2 Tax=Tenacibaculum maritimum TaxID=107401 RepID=UPI000401E2F9|nr:hypothetical protein [Tenacibaculum maritimum]MCD9611656.1 hypothetical protein [Tenacibaculum maritimum]CAA0160334.1 hypothetical protein TFA04_110023 [Tenacibaculum maritimum]CAA0248341.1 hypothetical protein CVI1001048_90015 [Tenacibaculum maritimum]
MSLYRLYKKEWIHRGFSLVVPLFTEEELVAIMALLKDKENPYAIKQLIQKFPRIQEIIFQNKQFEELYQTVCDASYFLSKAISFNKKANSNWLVSYHQDLSISVQEKDVFRENANWMRKK